MTSSLRKYQFPPLGYCFLNRAAARQHAEIVALSRNHGQDVAKKLTGNYPKYNCPQCDGYMNLTFANGIDSGAVAERRDCTCEGRKPPLGGIVGKVYPTILQFKSDFLAHVTHSENGTRVTFITGRSFCGQRNNGSTTYITMYTESGMMYGASVSTDPLRVLKLEKQKAQNQPAHKPNGTKALKRGPGIAHAKLKSCTVSKTATSKPTTAETAREHLCQLCNEAECNDQALYRLICTSCKPDTEERFLCMPCLLGICNSRSHHQWKDYPGDFIYKNPADGTRCPFDNTNVTHFCDRKQYDRRYEQGMKMSLPMPYGWLGDRPERSQFTFQKNLPVVRALVVPFYKKAAELQEEIVVLQRMRKGMERCYKRQYYDNQIKHYKELVHLNEDTSKRYSWLSSQEQEIPASDYDHAQKISSGLSPPVMPYDVESIPYCVDSDSD